MSKSLPLYQCHKQVRALKIDAVYPDSEEIGGIPGNSNGGAILGFGESGYDPIHVDAAWLAKHNPQPGGYYVVYEDGYTSYSPAKAFDDGYTLVPPDPSPLLSFGDALAAVKRGAHIARRGWNGKGMFVFYNPGYPGLPVEMIRHDTVRTYFDRLGVGAVTFVPSLSLKAADGTVVTGWLASQSDMLADDWEIVG